MMATCPICGTRRVIYWPEHWVYRRGETYYCSEDCMMVDETKDMKLIKMIAHVRGKGANRMRYKKDGTPAKKPGPKAKEVVINAVDVGAVIEAEQPGPKPKIETPETNPFMKKTVRPEIETPEAAKVEAVETPEKKSGLIYKIRAIDTGIGSWEYSEKYNWICFSAKDGKDGVTMTPAEWAQMLRDLPDVFRVLEVKRR